jgi:hypothetical protein
LDRVVKPPLKYEAGPTFAAGPRLRDSIARQGAR